MTDNPAIPADILMFLFIALMLALAWLALRRMGNVIAKRRQRMREPETHGDEGGYPRKAGE